MMKITPFNINGVNNSVNNQKQSNAQPAFGMKFNWEFERAARKDFDTFLSSDLVKKTKIEHFANVVENKVNLIMEKISKSYAGHDDEWAAGIFSIEKVLTKHNEDGGFDLTFFGCVTAKDSTRNRVPTHTEFNHKLNVSFSNPNEERLNVEVNHDMDPFISCMRPSPEAISQKIKNPNPDEVNYLTRSWGLIG